MKKSGFRVWLTGIIICGLISASLSYVLLGRQWPVGTDVSYYINPNTTDVGDEAWAVYYAAETWNQINPAGLTMTYSGTTAVTTYGYDSSNTICWENEGDSGTLATAWTWSTGGIIYETDIVFNDFHNWSTSGSHPDIETVALHEFGHWAGLDHGASGIMIWYYNGIQRSIDSDARAGFDAMYGGGSSDPTINLYTTSMDFSGSGSDTSWVRNSGEGTLNYQINDNRSWMSVSPSSGSSDGEWDVITVTVDSSGLGPGDFTGKVSVSSGDASNSPQEIDVTLSIQDRPPSVSITSPPEGTITTKVVTIEATASDDYGVSKVEFYVDNVLRKTDTSPPYNYDWDTGPFSSGDHTIKAVAYDTSNQTDQDSITLTIPEDKPPSVNISSPADGVTVIQTVTIKANATDDKGVSRVEFYVDNSLLKTDGNAPYTFEWNPDPFTSGFHTIKAIAYDTIDQKDEDSIRLKVDKPPDVTLTSPVSGTDVSGTVLVEASATDDFGISNVRFYINDVLKKTDTAAPYDFDWETSLFQNGNYEVEAVVVDIVDQTDQDTITNYVIPHPPNGFSARKENNSSVLLEEYINVLTWQANGLNLEISKYKIYQVVDGIWTFLSDVNGSTFEYWHRSVEKEKGYSYVLTAVDANGKEGEEASIDVQ